MTKQTINVDIRKLILSILPYMLRWGPIFIGISHQIAMAFFGVDRIYVFVKPPEYIGPWVSLEFQWWLVLAVASALIYYLIVSNRLSFPRRLAVPFYLYLVFLLIFVKPIF